MHNVVKIILHDGSLIVHIGLLHHIPVIKSLLEDINIIPEFATCSDIDIINWSKTHYVPPITREYVESGLDWNHRDNYTNLTRMCPGFVACEHSDFRERSEYREQREQSERNEQAYHELMEYIRTHPEIEYVLNPRYTIPQPGQSKSTYTFMRTTPDTDEHIVWIADDIFVDESICVAILDTLFVLIMNNILYPGTYPNGDRIENYASHKVPIPDFDARIFASISYADIQYFKHACKFLGCEMPYGISASKAEACKIKCAFTVRRIRNLLYLGLKTRDTTLRDYEIRKKKLSWAWLGYISQEDALRAEMDW